MHTDTVATGQASLLCSLPVEILEQIALECTETDHAALSETCRYLHFAVQRSLFVTRNSAESLIVSGIRRRNNAIISRALAYGPRGLVNMPVFFPTLLAQALARNEGWSEQVACSTTPLALAASLGHREQVSYLIHRGADIRLVGEDGMAPLDHAVLGLRGGGGDPLPRNFLYGHPKPWCKGPMEHLKIILKLLDCGVEPTVNLPDTCVHTDDDGDEEDDEDREEDDDDGEEDVQRLVPTGRRATWNLLDYILHLGAWHYLFRTSDTLFISESVRLVKRLLRSQEDVNAYDPSDDVLIKSAITLCTRSNQAWLQILRILLDRGADPNMAQSHQMVPFSCALLYPDAGIVDRRGRPCYHTVARMLLDYGADPNHGEDDEDRRRLLEMAIDRGGYVPLTTAAGMVEILLEYGADATLLTELDDWFPHTAIPSYRRSLIEDALQRTFTTEEGDGPMYEKAVAEGRADFDKLVELCDQQTASWAGISPDTPLPFDMLADYPWNSPLIPTLLKAGTPVSQAGLRAVKWVMSSRFGYWVARDSSSSDA